MSDLNKIIYFDKESINNILQNINNGNKEVKKSSNTISKIHVDLRLGTDVKVSMSFIQKLKFLFTGNISVNKLKQYDNIATITSTEISEFETLKDKLVHIENVSIKDIENSSTFFRTAIGFLRVVNNYDNTFDIKEFDSVVNNLEGYDTYKTSDEIYVRFNNTAFVSNYKRNDLLNTKIDLYCVYVGEFNREDFDYRYQINKMQSLLSTSEPEKLLTEELDMPDNNCKNINKPEEKDEVKLYDVIYASITKENNNE